MAFRLSTGLQKALCGDPQEADVIYCKNTISMGDGDGSVISGADTINDSGSGLGVFAKHDWILILSGDANKNVLVKALSVASGKIEVVAGSFTAVSAGSYITLVKLKSIGNLRQIFQNSTMDIYSGTRPSSADSAETGGTLLLSITLNGDSFSAGTSLNGLNIEQDAAGTTLNRATDPETGATEVWQGEAAASGTCGWGRWYSNDKVTGATTTGVHMDGTVATSGSDIIMENGTTVTSGATSNVTSVSLSTEGV